MKKALLKVLGMLTASILIVAGAASCMFSAGNSENSEQSGDSLASNIVVSAEKTSINVGESVVLTASVEPAGASQKVTWTSENPSVAIVGSSTGKVTGKAAGKAKIVATAKDGSGVTGYKYITVKAAETASSNLITSVNGTETWYAENGDWNKGVGGTAAGNLTSGFSYNYPTATNAQWQKQFKINTNASVQNGKSWKFTATVTTSKTVNNYTMKLVNTENQDDFILEDSSKNLIAGTNNIEWTGTSTKDIATLQVCFDFGMSEALNVSISNIKFVSSGSSSNPGTGNIGEVDKTSVNAGAGKSQFIGKSSGYTATNGTLVWSDEFNGTSLDQTIWSYEEGAGGWGNAEKQTYVKGDGNNLTVANGMMTITAKSDLTSARIKSAGKKTFQYGRMVARIKMDQGTGSWPAFWMLGENISENGRGWPRCGEIDIMEHANSDNFYYTTLHWNKNGSALNSVYDNVNYGTKSNDNTQKNIPSIDVTGWHEYGLIWNASLIQMTFDGTIIYAAATNGEGMDDTFKRPFFFLFNFAQGGNFVSQWDPNVFTNRPWHMYVDYVRVYQ